MFEDAEHPNLNLNFRFANFRFAYPELRSGNPRRGHFCFAKVTPPFCSNSRYAVYSLLAERSSVGTQNLRFCEPSASLEFAPFGGFRVLSYRFSESSSKSKQSKHTVRQARSSRGPKAPFTFSNCGARA